MKRPKEVNAICSCLLESYEFEDQQYSEAKLKLFDKICSALSFDSEDFLKITLRYAHYYFKS